MNSSNHGDNSENCQRNSSGIWPAIVDAIRGYSANQCAQANKANNPKPQPESGWAKAAAIGTCLGAILAFFAAVIFWCQLRTMEQANRDSREAFITGNRAWVTAQDATPIERPDGTYFSVSYKNVGKSPALDLRITQRVQNFTPLGILNGDAEKFINAANICRNEIPQKGMATSFPDTAPDVAMIDFKRADNRSVLAQFKEGGWVMTVLTCFAYKTFDNPHTTAACYYWYPDTDPGPKVRKCFVGQNAS